MWFYKSLENFLISILIFVAITQFNMRLFLYLLLSDVIILDIAKYLGSLFVTSENEQIPKMHYSLTLFLGHILVKKPLHFLVYGLGYIVLSQQTTIYSTIFGKILDMVKPGAGFQWANGWQQILLYTMTGVTISIVYLITTLLSAHVTPWLASEVRGYYFKYILGHSYFYFAQTLSGDILSKINNLTSSALRIIKFIFEECIPVIILSVSILLIFMREHPQFQYTLLAWIVVHSFIAITRLPKYIKISLENARQYSGLMGIIGNILQNIFVIKFLYSNDFERKYFDKYQNRDIDSFGKMMTYNAYSEIFMDVFCYLIFYSFIFIWQILYNYIEGIFTIGVALSTYNILRSVASQIWRTTENIGDMMLEISRCNDAMELLTIPNRVPDNYPNTTLQDGGDLRGSLVLKGLYFYYNNQTVQQAPYLFEDLNLEIEPYSRVAFVGSSGSGKSTLANLFLRLMDPIKGAIYMNGQNIAEVSKASLRNTISFIPQKEFLFNRPIFENIGYGCSEIREQFLSKNYNLDITFKNLCPDLQQRIVEAAKKSDSHNFIIDLPNGYDSIYGSGIRLSGGQCQRIMIARAFVANKAQFLILDEATSALDPDTEKSIQNSVQIMSEGKTVIVVAHKLNTIRDFDRIIVFEKGKIIEDGTHKQLIKEKGKYYNMWQSQTSFI